MHLGLRKCEKLPQTCEFAEHLWSFAVAELSLNLRCPALKNIGSAGFTHCALVQTETIKRDVGKILISLGTTDITKIISCDMRICCQYVTNKEIKYCCPDCLKQLRGCLSK